jgi:hypothetical protein
LRRKRRQGVRLDAEDDNVGRADAVDARRLRLR